MALQVKPGTAWSEVYARCQEVAPEAFDADRVRNLWGGEWHRDGVPAAAASPVDCSELAGPPLLDATEAQAALRAAADQHSDWSGVPLEDRRARVGAAVEALAEHRDLLSLLIIWEIGKTWRSATADVDRCLDGVRWYLDEIESMLAGRRPLTGPVSNIASWNYPMSVLMHAMLVQMLAGNATIAKAPTDGGVATLTLATALAHREGLPISLISGSGSTLSPVLVTGAEVGALAFVGGRDTGGQIAGQLLDHNKRHILEQEGLNCWGIWEFSDWDGLATHLRKGFEYAKQRCTAYPRYVVQRELFDSFLAAYLPVVRSITFGHPLAVEAPADELPELDFGPVISAAKAKDLVDKVDEAVHRGGIPLYRGRVEDGRFVDGQDTSSYAAPVAILEPPPSTALFHAEPFGPVDTITVVDTEAELLAAMNASNGALVASLACDDEDTAARMASQLQAFKVGVNKPRSRGDRNEYFGGRGASWSGAFVGGKLLVQAVTSGPDDERLYGNFPSYSLYPEA